MENPDDVPPAAAVISQDEQVLDIEPDVLRPPETYMKIIEEKEVYMCDKCDYKTLFKSNFLAHMRSVHKLRSVCWVCKKEIKRANDLMYHVESVHNLHMCDQCGNPVPRAVLKQHKEFGCNNDKPPKRISAEPKPAKVVDPNNQTSCEKCGKLLMRSYLSSHRRYHCPLLNTGHSNELLTLVDTTRIP
jgi:hypothetical protein